MSEKHVNKIDIVWDMETADPDDFLTLLLLAGHPRVNLKAVTITPGTPEQVGLVRTALCEWLGLTIPIGAYNLEHKKDCVSGWHYKAYGRFSPSKDAIPGGKLLIDICDEHTTLVTGAPLKNLGAAIELSENTENENEGKRLKLGRLVAQGGFAGVGVVPAHLQLEKFRGRQTCPTYNLNGAPAQALAALEYPGIGLRRFVSKNVCHGVKYDPELHELVTRVKEKSESLRLIHQGMEVYLRKNKDGKKFHDPLAACCAIEESVGTWAEVRMYREKGEWGAKLQEGSGTWIITDYNQELFRRVLTEY